MKVHFPLSSSLSPLAILCDSLFTEMRVINLGLKNFTCARDFLVQKCRLTNKNLTSQTETWKSEYSSQG